MKKISAIILSVILFISVDIRSNAQPLQTSAQSAILICAENGDVLYEKEADARLPMASLTKIMTATVVLEKLPTEEVVEIPPSVCGIEGSSVYLTAGERLSVNDLLYALLLQSANDAAAALAVAVSGSVEAFAEEMNAKAAEIGLRNTHFTNPHGLDDADHYSSARDLALLCSYSLKNEKFAEIVSTKNHTIAYKDDPCARYLSNHNRLLSSYDGCIGVKTGYTMRCGRCLVTAARRDGVTLIAVTLNDPCDWKDHAAMFDHGFSRLKCVELVSENEEMEINVESSAVKKIKCSAEPYSAILHSDVGEIKREVRLRRFYFAPIAKGETVGTIVFTANGDVIYEAEIKSNVTAEKIKYKRSLLEFIRSLFGR